MKHSAFDVANKIAKELTAERVDPNEVAKVAATLRDNLDGHRFFAFLDSVLANGQAVVRSGQTLTYYRNIRQICNRYLGGYKDMPEEMLFILGWSFRLMRYYRIENRLEQPPTREVLAEQVVKEQEQEADRHKGRIKEFRPDRNFGFIQPEDGGKDYFFHGSQLPADWQNPQAGQRVSFIIGQGRDGRSQAQQLRRE